MNQNHPFHLVNISPWPILGALSVMITVSGSVKWFYSSKSMMLTLGIINILLIMIQWWRDIIRESTFQGHHTKMVINGLRWGMILFIISEIFFFLSFFWTFFHSSLSPNIDIGGMWPPKGIITFNPFDIPLLNTIILLTSGMTITWSHHSLLNNNKNQSYLSMKITIFLGLLFTLLQMYEYYESKFNLSDSIYGSTFFITTGFHGLHVIIGTTFLLINLMRMSSYQYSMKHHFGFEAASWYWHFVDVIWLFLFISIYWWGN
uniref:Cytochrome c oxidase subunit 3 n=1 Tax=Arge aurora TaxID=2728854 RepID=A0A6M5U668_9HYME|nr:cytochrome c oxidase subunit III [Arge aurora]